MTTTSFYYLSLFRDLRDPRHGIVFLNRKFSERAEAKKAAAAFFEGPDLPWIEKDGDLSLGSVGENEKWNYGPWYSREGIASAYIKKLPYSDIPEEGPDSADNAPDPLAHALARIHGKKWFTWNGTLWLIDAKGKTDWVDGRLIDDRRAVDEPLDVFVKKFVPKDGAQRPEIFFASPKNGRDGVFGTKEECDKWEYLWKDAGPFRRVLIDV